MTIFEDNGTLRHPMNTASYLPADAANVMPRHWRKTERVGNGLMKLSGEKLDRLPNGFWHWDLLNVNVDINDSNAQRSVETFCSKWGAPVHPLRFSRDCFRFATRDSALQAVESTNVINREWALGGLKTPYVRWNEAAIALNDLQSGARALLLSILGEDFDHDALRFMSHALFSCSRTPFELLYPGGDMSFDGRVELLRRVLDESSIDERSKCFGGQEPQGSELYETFGLTNAICNQIAQDIMPESGPWRICSKCGMPFKRARVKNSRQQTERTNQARKTCADNCSGKKDRLHK